MLANTETRPELALALQLPTAIGLALMAGFLFNMSIVTAPALNGLSPEQALAAWKGINSKAHEPLFPLTVVGTGLLALGCAVAGWRTRGRAWHLSSALLYWIGVIGTTLTVETGINNAVVAATHPPLDLQRMLATWLAGNHVRATSALAAFVAAWIGCYNSNRQTSRGEPRKL